MRCCMHAMAGHARNRMPIAVHTKWPCTFVPLAPVSPPSPPLPTTPAPPHWLPPKGTITVNDSLDLLADFMGVKEAVEQLTNKVPWVGGGWWGDTVLCMYRLGPLDTPQTHTGRANGRQGVVVVAGKGTEVPSGPPQGTSSCGAALQPRVAVPHRYR